jgi:zinc/manganese transport system substrate-binding protein
VRWLTLIYSLTAVFSGFSAEPQLHVITSFLPLYCWMVNVVGEHAVVEDLLPARAEPHDYAFTPGDARKLARADLIVVNGLGLETWLPTFLRSSSAARARLIVACAGLDRELISGGHHAHEASHANPHVWLDPQLAIRAVSNILAGLQRVDSAGARDYASNAAAYIARLKKLDAEIAMSLSALTNRAIVTYHDAFPYFARRYGLEIAGVVERVPDVNPTPKYLAHLSRTMRERGIHVILIAPNSTTRLARRIADDLHVQLVELDTLESGPLSPSAYEERMGHNAAVLQKHLK